MTFPWELPPYYRRKHAERVGWPEDKIQRYVDDPMTDEFQGIDRTDTDALLPMDKLWEYVERLKRGDYSPPFTTPKDFWGPAEPDGEDPDCE